MKRIVVGTLTLLAAAWPLMADPPSKSPARGKAAKGTAEVKQLYGVDWHTKLEPALQKAAAGGKPVMILRVLGDLNGFM